MAASAEQHTSHHKWLHLVLAAAALELILVGGLLLGQIQMQKTLKTVNDKVATLEAAPSVDEHNMEMQAQFNMMASRLSAIQADLTQMKAKVLQP